MFNDIFFFNIFVKEKRKYKDNNLYLCVEWMEYSTKKNNS
jgi:hypothetical protein